MKRIIYLVCFATILVACKSKNEPQNTSFAEGDEVTIAVGMPNSPNQSSVRRIDGYTRGADGTIGGIGNLDFQWNAGDNITVTVDGKSSIFRMLEGQSEVGIEGSTNADKLAFGGIAYFRGKMPAESPSGELSISYGPQNVPTTQYYHYDGIARNHMRFESGICSLDTTVVLKPMWSAIRTEVSADFNYSTETGASDWQSYEIEQHNNIGKLNLKAFYFNNTTETPDFQCTYVVNKALEGQVIGADKSSIFIIFVLPAGIYRRIEVTPDVEGMCYATYKGETVLRGECKSPVTHAITSSYNLYPDGFNLEAGKYVYLNSSICISYTYTALKSPDDFKDK